ncbi:MAG: helix-turn-helix domain-containing protein [Bacillota bacterium]|nr:helix-turn-helix domain-containing protein [Bacillota bacterium]MDP4155320.1 helix-turn-helix domain-containing protein [Bacillota bacterium]
MLTKLLTLFPNAVLDQDKPSQALSQSHLAFFYDRSNNQWIGIPKNDLSEREFELLKTIYVYYEPYSNAKESNSLSPQELHWFDFLFLNGMPPADGHGSYIRMIQFQIDGTNVEKSEFESALKGFFSDVLIIWENPNNGIVIEKSQQKSISLTEKEFISLVQTLESDFFLKVSFYYGKQNLFNNHLSKIFQEEKAFFIFAQSLLGTGTVYSFERVFPFFVAHHIPDQVKQKLIAAFVDVFEDDSEMFATIKSFLENNLNASLTAKKLYVHRNTLQYRVDKFTDKTGIQLKDFYSAFTVFLACLIFELEDSH